jgi:Fe-Mn family superoxide dismutase
MSADDPSSLSRRDALTTLTLCSIGLVTSCTPQQSVAPNVPATTSNPPPSTPAPPAGVTDMRFAKVLTGSNAVLPLPFQPGGLNGISEKLIVSHHDNNYAGAVKNLNKVELELAQTTPDTPPFVVAGLRQSELTFRNSKTLHEAYFANLGGNGKRAGAIDKALTEAYGSAARWEEQFRATASGLGGGSGWTLLELELATGELRTCWSGNHTQTLSTAVPLLVLDMYEHSYQMDFGAAAARYIDAFFANIQWDEVNRRLERGLAAAKVLRG